MSEDETFSTTYEPFSGTAEETNTSSKPNRAGAGAGREPPSFLQVSGILLGFIFFAYFVLRFVNRRRFPNIKLKGGDTWDPIVANYTWSNDDKFKVEYFDAKDKKESAVKLSQLLMKWAISIIRFQEELQQQKQSMQIMVRSGQVSEDMLNRFNAAEFHQNEDMKSIVMESEQLKPGWSQSLFQQAYQLLLMEKKREQEQEEKRLQQEKAEFEKWEKQQQQEELKMREEFARKNAEELIRQEQEEKKRKKSQ